MGDALDIGGLVFPPSCKVAEFASLLRSEGFQEDGAERVVCEQCEKVEEEANECADAWCDLFDEYGCFMPTHDDLNHLAEEAVDFYQAVTQYMYMCCRLAGVEPEAMVAYVKMKCLSRDGSFYSKI